jgi:hypothetical protein
MSTMVRSIGRIKSWDASRGFGSVERAAVQHELAMDVSDWAESDSDPCEGQRVSFVEATTRNGLPVARSVRRCTI